MKTLIAVVLFVFALLNASFIGVVLTEMASLPVGIAAALLTMVVEAVGIHYIRKAIAAGAKPGASLSEGGP
jgi:hypothetical protein